MIFERFMDLQQEALEKLGKQKQAEQQRCQREQHRYDSLKNFHDGMIPEERDNALIHRNRLAMRGQLSILLDSQEQEVVLAELDLQQQQKALLAQFGKMKGLELVQKKRNQRQAVKMRREEQTQLDDWLNRNRRNR